MPFAYVKAVVYLLWWILQGMPVASWYEDTANEWRKPAIKYTRRETASVIWNCIVNEASVFGLRNFRTAEEIVHELIEKMKSH